MIKRVIHKLPAFIRQALSEQDGIASSKRIAYVAVIFSGLALFTFDVLAHRGLRSESISLFGLLLGSATAGSGIGAFAK